MALFEVKQSLRKFKYTHINVKNATNFSKLLNVEQRLVLIERPISSNKRVNSKIKMLQVNKIKQMLIHAHGMPIIYSRDD